MESESIYVSYSDKVAQKRDGSCLIYRRSLVGLLREMAAMPEVSFRSEREARQFKQGSPCIRPFDIGCNSLPYNDCVVERSVMRGSVVLIDLDNVKVADELWRRRDELHSRFPWVFALWFSVRGKMHLAVRADWVSNAMHVAVWEDASRNIADFLQSGIRDIGNDTALKHGEQCIAVTHTKGYEIYESVPYDTRNLALNPDFNKRIDIDYDVLFRGEETCRRIWNEDGAEKFVGWYERKRDCLFTVANKELTYDRHISIRTDRCSLGGVEASEFGYWLNDGSYYRLDVPMDGYYRYKKMDGRRRFVAACAWFYRFVMDYPFTDALYCTAKCYFEYCVPWYYDPSETILRNVARTYSIDPSDADISKFKVKELILPNPVIKSRVEGTKDYSVYTGRAQRSITTAITRQLQLDKVSELWAEGDTVESMVAKLEPLFGSVSASRVVELCSELRLKIGGRRRYEYVNCYDSDGRRVKKRAEDVDNVKYFKFKPKNIERL